MQRELCRTYIDPDLRDRFYARFGDKSLNYVVETAMHELLDVTEGQTDLEEVVRLAIRTHTQRNQLTQAQASYDTSSSD